MRRELAGIAGRERNKRVCAARSVKVRDCGLRFVFCHGTCRVFSTAFEPNSQRFGGGSSSKNVEPKMP